jgi:hypothetical protein
MSGTWRHIRGIQPETSLAAVQVAAGIGFTIFLVDMPDDAAELARFPIWEADEVDNLPTLSGAGKEDGGKDGGKGAAKRKGAAAKGGAKKARI